MSKLIFNSVLSNKIVKFMCADIANFYLNNPMDRYEYMKLPVDIIPEEIIQQYNLRNLAHKGFVYMEIQKGMYGLPQARKIENDKLKIHLYKFGYEPSPITPGLRMHQTCHLQFSLVVDDFGINMSAKRTSHISSMHLRRFIKYTRTGMENYTVAYT